MGLENQIFQLLHIHNLFYAINLNSSSIQYIFFAGTVASYPYPYNSLPLKEGDFFNGLPHQGEFGYAMAKKHAYTYLKILSETKFINYTYGIFTNLYGENDRFDQVSGHVIPSLIVKAFNAKQEHQPLDVWGDGSAIRDFLHFEDASEASIKCMLSASPPRLVNISSNAPVKIKYIATIIAKEAKIKEIKFLNDKPTGIPVRMIDNNIITSIGFKPKVDLSTGLKNLYHWYSKENLRCRK